MVADTAQAHTPEGRFVMVTLNMIVRNEAHVITRCLDSVRPLIDRVVVLDTGSTDGTQQVIKDWLSQTYIWGAVKEKPFVDFATSRNEAMYHAVTLSGSGHILTLDADEVLEWEEGFDVTAFKAGLESDLVDLTVRYGNLRYTRPSLYRPLRGVRYRGRVHEFLDFPGMMGNQHSDRITPAGIWVRPIQDGARSLTDKALSDIRVMLDALEEDPDPMMKARYTFYLAQTLRDIGNTDEAIEFYRHRAEMGGWVEEVAWSLYQIASLKERQGRPEDEVTGAYLAAWNAAPHRIEPIHALTRYLNWHHRRRLAMEVAMIGLRTQHLPPHGLFIEQSVYDWQMIDEASIAMFWGGRARDSRFWCQYLLDSNLLPEEHRGRVRENLKFAEAAI